MVIVILITLLPQVLRGEVVILEVIILTEVVEVVDGMLTGGVVDVEVGTRKNPVLGTGLANVNGGKVNLSCQGI